MTWLRYNAKEVIAAIALVVLFAGYIAIHPRGFSTYVVTIWSNQGALLGLAAIAQFFVVLVKGSEHFLLTSTDAEFEVFWTPDSRGVLLREHTSMTVTGARGMSMNLDETVISSHRPRPSVRVVAHTLRLASNAIAKWRDDDVSLFAGQAKGARARSTVYFAPGKEPLARRFAQRLGENTPVEPLSWATAYDVVVALGDAP